MSTIERLSIQGIRSFGGNAGDAQVIRFSSPVTLILGENGCGKTTIIECLKYALTGEFPPGSDRGKNFVHDPKISKLTDVFGQIKLEVRNVQGARLSICRSMKLGMKRNKITFETLDATLNYLNDDDKTRSESISKRCADVDLVMSQFMGVSKAIINNVLFCHQEDSSWPLDEPKKLKEKFDAIFGISEYNKALDRIIKMRKEEMEELKVKEANLRLDGHLKDEMEEKSLNLQKNQQKAQSIDDQCKQCDEEITPIEERLKQIHKIEYDVSKYNAQKVELQTKQRNCTEQMTSLRKKIKKIFEGSLEDLENEIASFSQKISEKRVERREVEQKLHGSKMEEKVLQTRYNDTDKKRVVLQQQQQKEQDCKDKRTKKLKSLCKDINIPITDDQMDSVEEITKILDNIQEVLTSEQCKITETISQHDKEDQERQTKIDQLRVELAKLQESVATLLKQKKTYEKESEQNEKNILQAEKSTQQLKVVTEKLKETEQYYEEHLSKFNQDEFRESIANDKTTVKALEEKFRNVDKRLTFLNSISKLVAEINLKEKELEKREQDVRRVKSKHSDNFTKVFEEGRIIESNYQRHLKASYEKSRIKIKEYNEKLNALKLKQQRIEIKRKNLKEALQKSEKELEDCKETIFEKCHSTPYEELLTKCNATVSKYQLELGAQKSAELFYKQYLQKIDEEPYCPLCQKCMNTDEASNLTTELTDKIQDLPENIKRIDKLLKEEQKKYDSLLLLKPVIEKVAHLENEIPKKKEEMQALQNQLAECSTEAENIQTLLAEPTANMDTANSMMGDMSLLDEAIKEAGRFKNEIEKLKRKMPENSENNDNVSIEEVQTEKTVISTELEEKRKELEKNQQYYEKNMEALNKLRELKNSLKDQQMKLQEGVQNLPQLKERQSELNNLLVAIATEIQEKQGKVSPLKQQLNVTITEKAQLKAKNRERINQMQKRLEGYKRDDHEINGLDMEVLDYQQLNLGEKIKNLDETLKSIKEEIKQSAQNSAEITEKLEAIKGEIANQEIMDRDLKDNRELKALELKEKDLNEKYQTLSEELGKLNFPNVSKEKSELTKKREKITVHKGELLGQRGEVKHQIKKLEKELAEPKYRDSLMNYKRTYYEVQLSKKVVNDMGQHRVALEWALMQFHTEKMREINRLIREYWRLIYRGNDIDYIQIQTEEGKDAASSMDRRRSYNYRVIQSKNNSEIEMRGRCSAGQRVLASLIIRMALAETFSSNCGVLALDEPTTNLDRANILSLCDALNRIVEERQSQSNFMLIIITHDEAFISTLGKINSYHRVSRNEECKSVISKKEVA